MSNKANVIMREKQRAWDKAEEQQSFIARNYWLWVAVAFFIYPFAALLSAFTEGSNIYFRFSATGAPPLLVMVAVLMLVFIIETLSYFLGKGAIDDVQAGVFSRGPSDVAMWAIKSVGFVAIMSFSVFLSLNGAPLLNEKLRKSYTPPDASYVSLDSIQAAYAAELAPHQSNIAAMQKTRWKGSITANANKSIVKSQDLIAEIERRRTASLDAATAENSRVREEWEAETATNSSYAMGFAGLGEIVKLFCLVFIGLYDQGLSKEAAVFGGSPTPPAAGGHGQRQSVGFNVSNNQATPPYYGREDPNLPSVRTKATEALRTPIGFRRAQQPAAADKIEPDLVATSSYSPDDEELGAEIYLEAYKSAKSTRDSWLHKAAPTKESQETKARNVAKWEKEMATAEAKLQEMGYRIVLKNRRFSLSPSV